MLNIILKDMKLMLSDRKELAAIILMPIILTTILSFALIGSFQEMGSQWTMDIAVVRNYDLEQDQIYFRNFTSSLEERFGITMDFGTDEETLFAEFNPEKIFFEDFLGSDEMEKFIQYTIVTEEEAYELLENKRVRSIVILPDQYVYNAYVNTFTTFRNNIDITVVSHPDMNYSRQITEEIISSFNNIMSSITISKNVYFEKASDYMSLNEVVAGLEDFVKAIGTEPAGVNVVITDINQKNFINSFTYYSIAMMSMFILFSAGYGGKFILNEKIDNTYYRLMATGVDRRMIITGKFFMMFIMAIIQSIVLIVYSKIAFGINWINLQLLLLTMLLSCLAVASIGVFIIALTIRSNSYKTSDAFSNALVQVLALAGGSYLPLQILPKAVGQFGRLTPNGATLQTYIKILEGYGISEILPGLAVIMVNIAVMLLLSGILLKGGDSYDQSIIA
jgi:ABC-type multidrug transport system permease subunit